MEYVNKILEFLIIGNSPDEWLVMKLIMSLLGGFSAYIFKYYFHATGETKIPFFWKGFWFTIISSFGGVFILGPQKAVNAYVAGLLGWSAIANLVKQENKGASNEQFSANILSEEQIQEFLNKGRNND